MKKSSSKSWLDRTEGASSKELDRLFAEIYTEVSNVFKKKSKAGNEIKHFFAKASDEIAVGFAQWITDNDHMEMLTFYLNSDFPTEIAKVVVGKIDPYGSLGLMGGVNK